MYSNTPSDFDFKLRARGASGGGGLVDADGLAAMLREECDIVFPALHGRYGEDGEVQALLERGGLRFVGTKAEDCRRAFDKYVCSQYMRSRSYCALPQLLCTAGEPEDARRRAVREFFASIGACEREGLVIVKPCRAGSSVGVGVARGVDDALRRVHAIIEEDRIDDRVVVELFLDRRGVGAREFTTIIVDTGGGPVALMPTEVEVVDAAPAPAPAAGAADGADDEVSIFDYRRKYLPTTTVRYHTPPTFDSEVVDAIRGIAQGLFGELNLQDFARIDGWFIPSPPEGLARMLTAGSGARVGVVEGHGIVIFSDVNITSGMEQTSFLFQQAAECRMSHASVLQQIIGHAIGREGLPAAAGGGAAAGAVAPPAEEEAAGPGAEQAVFVLFGGGTSERQVSLMSGTNVWLKLREQREMRPLPFLLLPRRSADERVEDMEVMYLPYRTVLRHTVEEVEKVCAEILEHGDAQSALRSSVIRSLSGNGVRLSEDMNDELPARMSLREFASLARSFPASRARGIGEMVADDRGAAGAGEAVVYIAVHGGVGEDGTIQQYLLERGVKYTGCRSDCARLCMDKRLTSEALAGLAGEGIHVAPKRTVTRAEMAAAVRDADAGGGDAAFGAAWRETVAALSSGLEAAPAFDALCIKPAFDGCSTGVAKLNGPRDLATYFRSVASGAAEIDGALLSSASSIAMPSTEVDDFIVEPFVRTGRVVVVRSRGAGDEEVRWDGAESDWVEVTTGVMAMRELGGRMHSLNPSITVKEDGDILSLDEKFQGGTGINLTPPPPSIVSAEALRAAKRRFERVAEELGISGYSRIDAFMHVDTGALIVIEVNTVPGQTPSTVLFHQTMAEDDAGASGPITPGDFFARVVEDARARA